MVRPAPQRIRRDSVRAFRAGRHIDGVLADVKLALIVLDVAPHAVQMNRVGHHRVVDEHDAEPFAVRQLKRLGIGKFDAVERPGEARNVTREVQINRADWLANVRIVEGVIEV